MIKITTNVDEVNRALQKRLQAMPAEVRKKTLKWAAVKFLRLVIPNTPVDTGYLRAGWHAFFHSAITGPNVDSAKVTLASRQAAAGIEEGDIFIVLNNPAEYGLFVEEGTVRMPGRHMVSTALHHVALGLTHGV